MGSTGWVLSLQTNSQHGAADKDDAALFADNQKLILFEITTHKTAEAGDRYHVPRAI